MILEVTIKKQLCSEGKNFLYISAFGKNLENEKNPVDRC